MTIDEEIAALKARRDAITADCLHGLRVIAERAEQVMQDLESERLEILAEHRSKAAALMDEIGALVARVGGTGPDGKRNGSNPDRNVGGDGASATETSGVENDG